jgi:hypothetical protein
MDGMSTSAVIQVTGVAEMFWNWGAGRESTVRSGEDVAGRLERQSRRAPRVREKSRKMKNGKSERFCGEGRREKRPSDPVTGVVAFWTMKEYIES